MTKGISLRSLSKAPQWAVLLAGITLAANVSWAGSIVLTGHDPDFHAIHPGENNAGAQHINQAAIRFIMDPAFNPFVARGVTKFLLVESKIVPPPTHEDGCAGMAASAPFKFATAFDCVDHTTLNTDLDNLGTTYGGIAIGSDCGGILTQKELNILNARANDIIDFLNRGGGLYAMAETNPETEPRCALATGPLFAFLPSIGDQPLPQGAPPFFPVTLTPFGATLLTTSGAPLTNADLQGNANHNVFACFPFGLQVVDLNGESDVLTLAGRPKFIRPCLCSPTFSPAAQGAVPQPGPVAPAHPAAAAVRQKENERLNDSKAAFLSMPLC